MDVQILWFSITSCHSSVWTLITYREIRYSLRKRSPLHDPPLNSISTRLRPHGEYTQADKEKEILTSSGAPKMAVTRRCDPFIGKAPRTERKLIVLSVPHSHFSSVYAAISMAALLRAKFNLPIRRGRSSFRRRRRLHDRILRDHSYTNYRAHRYYDSNSIDGRRYDCI